MMRKKLKPLAEWHRILRSLHGDSRTVLEMLVDEHEMPLEFVWIHMLAAAAAVAAFISRSQVELQESITHGTRLLTRFA
jgi:hypothetical protein